MLAISSHISYRGDLRPWLSFVTLEWYPSHHDPLLVFSEVRQKLFFCRCGALYDLVINNCDISWTYTIPFICPYHIFDLSYLILSYHTLSYLSLTGQPVRPFPPWYRVSVHHDRQLHPGHRNARGPPEWYSHVHERSADVLWRSVRFSVYIGCLLGYFLYQRASNAERVYMSWRLHGITVTS